MSETPKLPRMRVHLLASVPKGAIQGGGGREYVIACEPSLRLSDMDRGTGEPWAVRCDACRATEFFKAIDRPKPGTRQAAMQMDADGSGCCG